MIVKDLNIVIVLTHTMPGQLEAVTKALEQALEATPVPIISSEPQPDAFKWCALFNFLCDLEATGYEMD